MAGLHRHRDLVLAHAAQLVGALPELRQVLRALDLQGDAAACRCPAGSRNECQPRDFLGARGKVHRSAGAAVQRHAEQAAIAAARPGAPYRGMPAPRPVEEELAEIPRHHAAGIDRSTTRQSLTRNEALMEKVRRRVARPVRARADLAPAAGAHAGPRHDGRGRRAALRRGARAARRVQGGRGQPHLLRRRRLRADARFLRGPARDASQRRRRQAVLHEVRQGQLPDPAQVAIARRAGRWSITSATRSRTGTRQAVEAELRRRGLDPEPDTDESFHVRDPDGYRLQIGSARLMYVP